MRAVAPAGPGVPRAVTHGALATSAEAWLDLVVAEDDWVRREFDEIVAAGWGARGTVRAADRARRWPTASAATTPSPVARARAQDQRPASSGGRL